MRTGLPEYQRKHRIYRSRDAVFFGVCGGVAEYFDFSPWALRILCLLAQFSVAPWLFIPYLILGALLKKAPPLPFRSYDEEEFWNAYQSSRSEALRKVRRNFEGLDRRLQRMERIVTTPGFEMEDEFKRL